MPDKTYPGPFKGSRYTQYKKDPIKGYSRDLILKSGVVHHDTSGEFSKETQERKRRSRADAEKRVGWASKDGLEHLGKGLMITGGATGATLAWGGTQYIKKLKRDAQERAYKQQDQAGRSASLAKGRDRTLPSATRQEINDAVTRNPDAPKDTSVRKDMGGGRRVRPVAGTPRIRLTQEQINERVARTRKGTEPMAERAPIQPGRRIINDAGSSTPSVPKKRVKTIGVRGQFTEQTRRIAAMNKYNFRYGTHPSSVAVNRDPITSSQLDDISERFNANRAVREGRIRQGRPGYVAPDPLEARGLRSAASSTPTPSASTRTGPPRRTTPVTRGGAEPRVPSPTGIASRNVGADSKYSGRKVGYSYKEPGMDMKAIADARVARRGGSAPAPTPSTGGRAPGIAVNRDPITTEQKQAIARARNARRTPAPTPPAPTPPARTPDRPGGSGGFRAGANGAAEAAARRSAFPSRPGGSGGFRAGANGAAEAAARGEALGWKGAATKTAEVAKTAGKGARVMSGLKLFGKVAGVAAGLAGASELYDRLAPKDWARAPWMSGGKEPVRAPQVTQEQPFTPYPGGTASTGGNKGGGSGGGSTMTQQARASQRAIRKPDDYLGEAFDATLRKGVDKGTAHLEHMMKMDNLDEDTRASLRNRFKKVQNDKILSQQKDKGIVERLDAEKAGRGENLLKAYRKEGGFNYGKGGKYEEIKRLAEKGTEYAAQ